MPVDLSRAAIRARSRLLRSRYTEAVPNDGDDLDELTADAAMIVADITGRLIGAATQGEAVPDELVGVAQRAVAMKVEQWDTQTTAEASEESSSTTGRLRSISAGSWSESYFAPGELVVKNGKVMVEPGNERLSELLWALMTQEKRDEWTALATGIQAPAASVTQFDYRQRPARGY